MLDRNIRPRAAGGGLLILLLASGSCSHEVSYVDAETGEDLVRGTADISTPDTPALDTPPLDTGGTEVSPTPDITTDRTDTRIDQGNGPDVNDICSQIERTAVGGQTCDPSTDSCDDWSICLQQLAAPEPSCHQFCAPEECSNICAAEETCEGLVDEEGNPVYFGGSSIQVGWCRPELAGTVGAYDECGPEAGACQSGLDCSVLSVFEGSAPFCVPDCTGGGSCPDREGVEGECLLAGSNDEAGCALPCDPSNAGTGTGCPAGLTCFALDEAALCLPPAQ